MSYWNTQFRFEPGPHVIPDLTVSGRKVTKVGELSAIVADHVHPYLNHPSGGSFYGVGVGPDGTFTVFRDSTVLASGRIEHQKVLNKHRGERA
jgi:hypothetical protein